MNNNRGNKEMTVNIPKGADFETFKLIIQQRTGSQTEEGLEQLYTQFTELNKQDAKAKAELIAIIGDLYEKYKDKTDYTSLKKTAEIQDVANYLYDTGKKVSIIAEGESPDFIVEIDGQKIGLEHTVYVDDDVVAKISTVQVVFSSVEKRILNDKPNAKLLLNVSLYLDQLPNKTELESACYNYFVSIINNAQIDKPTFINNIIVSKHETFQIKYNEECMPAPIDIQHFEAKLDAKNAKIENYKAKSGLDKINLLIVIDGVGCKSNFYIDLEKMPRKERAFSEIIIYNRFERTILVGRMS